MAGQPFSMRTGHDPVLATLQVQDRRAYLAGLEAPGCDVGQVVVDRPARAFFDGLPGDPAQPGPGAGERRVVGRGELVRLELSGPEISVDRRASLDRGTQFGLAERMHAREPVQPL